MTEVTEARQGAGERAASAGGPAPRASGRRPAGRAAALALMLAAAGVRPLPAESPSADPPLTMRGYDQRVQDGVDLIYRLRFAEADAHFARLTAAQPDHPLGHFFYAMVDWWRVLADLEDRSHDAGFYGRVGRCIEVCDRRLEADPDDFDAILFKGGAIGFRGRLRGDRGQYLHAARDGLASLPLLKRSRQLEPTNRDILFGQGVFNYFRAVIPERYPVVQAVTWMLEAGDRELGLRQLEEVAREGRYARAEALYFLAQIHRVFENDAGTALRYLEELHGRYPENALFHRYRARALTDVGRWDEGMALYRDAVRRAEGGQVGYHLRGHIESLYHLGKGAFLGGRYDEVVEAMAAADRLGAGLPGDAEARSLRGYVPLANLYLGMALDALGRHAEARARYARVLDLPGFGSSHKLARRYLEQAYQPP